MVEAGGGRQGREMTSMLCGWLMCLCTPLPTTLHTHFTHLSTPPASIPLPLSVIHRQRGLFTFTHTTTSPTTPSLLQSLSLYKCLCSDGRNLILIIMCCMGFLLATGSESSPSFCPASRPHPPHPPPPPPTSQGTVCALLAVVLRHGMCTKPSYDRKCK